MFQTIKRLFAHLPAGGRAGAASPSGKRTQLRVEALEERCNPSPNLLQPGGHLYLYKASDPWKSESLTFTAEVRTPWLDHSGFLAGAPGVSGHMFYVQGTFWNPYINQAEHFNGFMLDALHGLNAMHVSGYTPDEGSGGAITDMTGVITDQGRFFGNYSEQLFHAVGNTDTYQPSPMNGFVWGEYDVFIG